MSAAAALAALLLDAALEASKPYLDVSTPTGIRMAADRWMRRLRAAGEYDAAELLASEAALRISEAERGAKLLAELHAAGAR